MTIPMKKLMATLLLASSAAMGLSACDNEGPAEQLGEDVDEAVQDAQRNLEDATD